MGSNLKKGLNATIGIIIPAYNVGNNIQATLDSLLAQTYTDWLATIVNDGSTDNTEAVLAHYAATHPNIQYTSIVNTGSAHIPRLTAAKLSNATWLCNIDADDVVEPYFLEKLMKRAKEAEADLVCPLMLYTTPSGQIFNRVPNTTFNFNQILTGHEAASLTFRGGTGSLIATAGMLCRKELYEPLIENMQVSQYVYQDEIDDFKVLLSSQTIAFCPAEYTYYKNDKSVTHTASVKTYDKLLTEMEYNAIIHREFHNLHMHELGNQRFFSVMLGRRLKYLYEYKYFDKKARQEIDAMFQKAYAYSKNIHCPSHFNARIFFKGSFYTFKLMTKLLFLLQQLRGKR